MDATALRGLPWRSPATCTLLVARGADARSLLHRISTRELADLAPGQARGTLFCDYRGRLLHRAAAIGLPDGVLLARDDAPAAELAAWVDRHVFREDCRLEELAPRVRLRVTRGAAARAWCEAAGLGIGETRETAQGVRLVRPAADLLWSAGEADTLDEGLGPAAPAGADEERLRIAAGWPAHGREIREEFNPYEVGLAHEVHLAKGCYTGQEALQRLVTYGSVRRRLARVCAPGAPPRATPLDLWNGADRGGRLTSAVAAPDGWIGLAVVPRDWRPPEHRVGPENQPAAWSLEPVEESAPLGRVR